MRHYLNLHILWSTLTEFRTIGPYELNWETQQYKCWISQVITFALLASLQAVNLFWLFLILRIAKNYVFTSHVEDDRSEVEDNEDGEEEKLAADAAAAAAPPHVAGVGTMANGKPKSGRHSEMKKEK